MNDLEHNETCACDCEHEQTTATIAVEEGAQDLSGPVQLSPEEQAKWEKKETARKLRNARKKAKQMLMGGAKSKRERRYVRKVLSGNMSIS